MIFFDASVNEIVFLVSFSDSSLLVYENATNFWIFILYAVTLLNSFLSSSSILVESLGFCAYIIISSANNDSFLSNLDAFCFFFLSDCRG